MRSAIVLACLVCSSAAQATRSASDGERVAQVAKRFLEEKPSLRREDCSGLVEDILREAGAPDRRGGASRHWQQAIDDGRVALDPIRPGDLVFFDRTYDANRNGRVDDALTHVAIAVEVLADETVIMVHRSSSKIEELRLNLRTPHANTIDGALTNSFLRAPGYGGRASPRLAGQLYRGHVRPPRVQRPVEEELIARAAPLEGVLFCAELRPRTSP